MLAYSGTLLVEKIYKKQSLWPLISFLHRLSLYSILLALGLSTLYFFLFFDRFFTATENHLVFIPILLIILAFLFKNEFYTLVFILIKRRLKIAFTLLSLSFINHFVLDFKVGLNLQNVLLGANLENTDFDVTCYILFLMFLKGFFNLTLFQQSIIIIPLSLFVERIIFIPEINYILLVPSSEENNEFEQANINSLNLIKPFIEKMPQVRNSAEVLSQRTALSIAHTDLSCPWKAEFEKYK